jgi:dTDP-4-dehydrorhamnose 3,5-epimerase
VPLQVTPTELDRVLLVESAPFRDERGFFVESYHKARFTEHGIEADFVQDNHSRSSRHVLRGLHWQDMTAPMGKLVRCTVGAIFDVAVDLRIGSPTFARWVGRELSAANMRQLWIPPGFGHGFVAVSEAAEVQYKCSGYYTPSAERTLAWNDPDVNVEWPVPAPVVSPRDAEGMSLADYLRDPSFTYEAG